MTKNIPAGKLLWIVHMLSKNIEISNFKLNQPKGYVIQNKKDFNFDYMILKLFSKY